LGDREFVRDFSGDGRAVWLLLAARRAVNLSLPSRTSASDRAMATRYEQSAQAGDDDAQFYLGALYSPASPPAQRPEAFRWFSRATDQGHAHSMLDRLPAFMQAGRGVRKDNIKRLALGPTSSLRRASWTRTAMVRGKLMTLLMKKMTSDEIGRAVVAARAWRAVRVAGAGKAASIERALEQDQPAAAAPPPAPAVVQPAPAASPTVAQGGAILRHSLAGISQGHVGAFREECKAR
jgi:TPR repeat protein